jgi:hypothetical protein
MLRAWFVLGAMLICAVGIAYEYVPVPWIGDDTTIAIGDAVFVVLVLIWVTGVIGITAYRTVRSFAKSS